MKIKYPNYQNSILSLASSVLKHYGAQTNHTSLACFDELLERNYKNVIIMLFDGMGTTILEKHLPPESFLRRNFCKTISSVFPSTTTAATLTMETGLSPIEHGWLGWSLYFTELDANVSIFPNTLSGSDGKSAADFHVARKYIPYKDIFTKILEATSGEVQPIQVSYFSEYKSSSVTEICNTVNSLCGKDGRKYIYTYWHQPDYDMHDLGTEHSQIAADIKDINDKIEEMCNSISETLVIVTADHGLVDTQWLFIPDYPEVAECLERMPSIESRAMTFFIKQGQNEKFEGLFKKHFGDYYILFSKEEVISKKLFGDGIPHSRSMGFIGDYLAVATSNFSIECSPSTQHDTFKAAHAGLTEDEMNIPFISIDCI